jgi:hypothetical protein
MKKFSEYLEAVQENKDLEVQNEGILASLGILGVGALGWLYIYTKACVVGWDYAPVTVKDMLQGFTEIFGGPTRLEIEEKKILGKLYAIDAILLEKEILDDFNLNLEEEMSNESAGENIQILKRTHKRIIKVGKEKLKEMIKENFKKLKALVPEKFKNLFKSSPNSK